jgi:hypothetical protein
MGLFVDIDFIHASGNGIAINGETAKWLQAWAGYMLLAGRMGWRGR